MGYKNGQLSIWDTRTGEETFRTQAHDGRITGASYDGEFSFVRLFLLCTNLFIVVDGKFIVSCGGDDDNSVKIWDAQRLQNLQTIPYNSTKNGEVLCCAICPHNTDHVLAGGDDDILFCFFRILLYLTVGHAC